MKNTPNDLIDLMASVVLQEDYWVKEGRLWTRHHVKPRSTLCVPLNVPGGPPIDRLNKVYKNNKGSTNYL